MNYFTHKFIGGLLIAFCMLFSVPPSIGQQLGEIVSLNGNQFKLGGNNFYPVAVNYSVDIVHNGSGGFYIAPNHSYFASNRFECANEQECFDELVADFNHIRSLGFNSLRIVGLGFGTATDQNGIQTTVPSFRSKDNVNNVQVTPISTNYQNMFDFIQSTLDAAEIADLKVQILVGGKEIDLVQFEDAYIQYLTAISGNFASNTTLYSYDFMNEPLFEATLTDKSEICDLVRSWNNAIKSNCSHLTTIGLATSSETINWDPGILEVDFLSFHLYPNSGDVDIVRSEISWISQTSPLPWMIGETGFRASNEAPNQTLDHVDGTLQEQSSFTQNTLELVRDCGGIGYTWWQYKDVAWGLGTDYFGVVSRTSNTAKPFSSEFSQFDPWSIA